MVDTHTTSEVFCQSSSCLDLVCRLVGKLFYLTYQSQLVLVKFASEGYMDTIKIELTVEELNVILNVLTIKSLSDNLDKEEKVLGNKIMQALKKTEEK